MYTALQTGAIGIRDMPLPKQIHLAADNSFTGLSFSIEEAVKIGVERTKTLFAEKKVKPATWGLPLNLTANDADFERSLTDLVEYASSAKKLECHRTSTWILPFSDEVPFDENFELHRNRIRATAQVLADYDCSLGVEFIGPKTSRQEHKYEFIHTMDGMLKLCRKVGSGNVGLLLDAWHLYTSHGTTADLTRLTDQDVVVVHINDAPRDVPVDEQIDKRRCLPGETGVIDIVGFMKGLEDRGYTGPVIAEPFNERVNRLPPDEAARATAGSLMKIWEQAGL